MCDHGGYDDYFERCNDCGKTNADIHYAECIYMTFQPDIDDQGKCSRCGVDLLEINQVKEK